MKVKWLTTALGRAQGQIEDLPDSPEGLVRAGRHELPVGAVLPEWVSAGLVEPIDLETPELERRVEARKTADRTRQTALELAEDGSLSPEAQVELDRELGELRREMEAGG